MSIFAIMPYYLAWHYGRSLKNFMIIWSNFLWFVWNFFSVKNLMLTFFSPFERIQTKYKGGLDVEDFLASMVANTLMRIVGAFARGFIILLGIFSWFLILLGGFIAFFIWLLTPFIIIFIFVVSIMTLLK